MKKQWNAFKRTIVPLAVTITALALLVKDAAAQVKNANVFHFRSEQTSYFSPNGTKDSTVFTKTPILFSDSALRNGKNVFVGQSSRHPIQTVDDGAGTSISLGDCKAVPQKVEAGTVLEWQNGSSSYKLTVTEVLPYTHGNGTLTIKVKGDLDAANPLGSLPTERGRAYTLNIEAASVEVRQASDTWYKDATEWSVSYYFLTGFKPAFASDPVSLEKFYQAVTDSMRIVYGVTVSGVTMKMATAGSDILVVAVATAMKNGQPIAHPKNGYAAVAAGTNEGIVKGTFTDAILPVTTDSRHLDASGRSVEKRVVYTYGNDTTQAVQEIIPTGIRHEKAVPEKMQINVYPNPAIAGQAIRIRASMPGQSTADIAVYNMQGEIVAVLANPMELDGGTTEFSLQTGGLPSGTYTAMLVSGNQSSSFKFVIKK